ncbi:DUF6194 family protein [Pontivivens ytuae]|uniref:DUF6194 domain-containing protein n=1 Tax=Pontivivens ytuae TaxID=2789856 RepID=A0A7S9LTE6_9RHOB|nr:DUF6194 family protein [Pontivivens ytuae]QPH54806.1 hypothetical protein I0K15_03270 [Pontivivens ytuae]
MTSPDALPVDELIARITTAFPDLAPQPAWGEVTFYYNPGGRLRRGTYVCTIKERDGPNDRASRLDRPGVYRLNFGLPRPDYLERFGPPPPRPAKGRVIEGEHDFTALDRLMPHPVYGWMGWVAILNPSRPSVEALTPLLALSHAKAAAAFARRTA